MIARGVDGRKKAGRSIARTCKAWSIHIRNSLKRFNRAHIADSLASWAGANKAMRMGYVQNGINPSHPTFLKCMTRD